MRNNFVLTIFGIFGDVSKKKIIPSLFKAYSDGEFGDNFHIIGLSYHSIEDNECFNMLREELIKISDDIDSITSFLNNIKYIKLNFSELNGYRFLKEEIEKLNVEQYLFYFAVNFYHYTRILVYLNNYILSYLKDKTVKLLIEKPIGNNLESFLEIKKAIDRIFDNGEVYYVDHYLFKNKLRDFLESGGGLEIEGVKEIDVKISESIDADPKYNQKGVIIDMFQSHAMQLALSALGREDRVKKLKSMDIVEFMVAQYIGYDSDVGEKSYVPSFIYAKLMVDSRWGKIPIYIRTGRGMKNKLTEILYLGKENVLLQINSEEESINDYKNIILEAIDGDKKYFLTPEEILISWLIADKIILSNKALEYYSKGEIGP